MLRQVLKAEQMKLKHSPIWLAFIVIPIISALMGTFNYAMNIDILQSEWYSLWTQHTIFYCYLCFPALVGVYCSYSCRLEHMQNNWKSLLAEPVKLGTLYAAKFLSIIKILIATQLLVGILFFISGKVVGLTSTVPKEVFVWLLYGILSGSVIIALQLGISLKIKSFALPIAVALVGGIAGLVARANGMGLIFPYALFPIGMCANSPDTGLECGMGIFLISCLVFMVIFSFMGIRILKRCAE